MRRNEWPIRALGKLFGVAVGLALSAGCVGAEENAELDYTVKSVDDARAEARDLSSTILDMTGIQGQVSEPGPGVSVCGEDPARERLYKIRHPWSIYGVSSEALEAGMERIRQGLLEQGWTIIEEGELNNADRTPRILFENTDVEYAVNVELPGGTEEYDPMLTVDIESACFSTPEGESPANEH